MVKTNLMSTHTDLDILRTAGWFSYCHYWRLHFSSSARDLGRWQKEEMTLAHIEPVSEASVCVKIPPRMESHCHWWAYGAAPFMVCLRLTFSAPRLRNTVNFLSALACFIIVVAYLYGNAIPLYNTTKWETSVQFTDRLPLPSFAFIIQNDDSSTASYTSDDSGYSIYAYTWDGDSPGPYSDNSTYIRTFQVGGTSYTALVANGSGAARNTTDPLGAYVEFDLTTICEYCPNCAQFRLIVFCR